MKNILTILSFILCFNSFSQSLYIPSNPDSIKVPVNVNGAVRTVYSIDLVKYRAALTARDTAAALRLLIAANTSAIATNTTNISANTIAIGTKLNISDTVNKWLPKSTVVGLAPNTVTEQKTYYRGEYYANQQINTSTGAVSVNTGTAISDFIHIAGGESITISVPPAYSNITIYGWTYDTSLAPISEIRSNTLLGTTLKTYTFTSPSNARFLNIYVKYGGVDFAKALQVKSTNTITYNTPITPEQFTGTKSAPIQAALDFARFTSSGVVLTGSYTVDSSLILSSGSTLVLNNAKITLDSASKTNIIRNESVANPLAPFHRATKEVRIIGLGKSIIEGSKANWGGYPATGVGTQYWRAIGIEFANVENFEISGITVRNTNMFAMNMEQSRVGLIKDISIRQDSAHSNQDGINIRAGSNRISIENVRGVTQDDMIALTNLKIGGDSLQILGVNNIYEPYKTDFDIHSIIIKNIQRDTSGTFSNVTNPTPFFKTGILLLCEDVLKIHDVTIDGVTGPQQIQVGFTFFNYAVSTFATVNDMYNISVSNTHQAKINFARPIKNSSFTNIANADITGGTSGVFANGSSKLLRKYYNANFEFYDSTYAGATPTITTGRIGIGTASPSYEIDVNKATAGAQNIISVTNTSTATGSTGSTLRLANSATSGFIMKTGIAYTPYKTFSPSDMGFYNSGVNGGNISILNDVTNGNINFAAGASSTAQMTLLSTGNLALKLGTAPTSATDTGTTGEIRITVGFIYVCIAANTWVRSALTTF